MSLTGALSLSLQQTGKTTSNKAIAGSVSTDDAIDTTKAYIQGATITAANLDVTADHGGYIGSLTAGGAGATGTSMETGGSGSTAVAGSVAINTVLPDTEAYLNNVTATLYGDSVVKANEHGNHRSDRRRCGVRGKQRRRFRDRREPDRHHGHRGEQSGEDPRLRR